MNWDGLCTIKFKQLDNKRHNVIVLYLVEALGDCWKKNTLFTELYTGKTIHNNFQCICNENTAAESK